MPRHNKAMQIGLPKWPAMTVSGSVVTPRQAAEILIRTNNFSDGSNDHAWERTVLTAIGLKLKRTWPQYEAEDLRGVEKELGILPLSYLCNSQIMSQWIGGPHGWIGWNGWVGCRNYNIGKWPSVEEVKDEWRLIAETFPYLALRCQLWPGETGEMATSQDTPLVEFLVRNGKVRVREGKPQSCRPSVFQWNGTTRSERGCSEQALLEALKITRQNLDDALGRQSVWEKLTLD